jgi:hypothetical protein
VTSYHLDKASVVHEDFTMPGPVEWGGSRWLRVAIRQRIERARMSTRAALLPRLGLAGALAFMANASCHGTPPVAPDRPALVTPDSSRCSWRVPAPIPARVIQRALELLARGDPLGTEYVESLDGTIYKFRRAMHPPNPNNLKWHPGIDAQACTVRAGSTAATP